VIDPSNAGLNWSLVIAREKGQSPVHQAMPSRIHGHLVDHTLPGARPLHETTWHEGDDEVLKDHRVKFLRQSQDQVHLVGYD